MTTSRDLVNALERHYRGGPGHRDQDACATWTELTSPQGRRADFIALGLWQSRQAGVIGHEIKVTRSDWLAELAQPSKAEEWWKACSRWYLVVPDASIVQDGELPPGWGLMVPPPANRRSMQIVVPTPDRKVTPPEWLTTAMIKRDRTAHANRLHSAVQTAKYEARQQGYNEGKAALEKRVGRIITAVEEERLELLTMIERELGHPIERYAFTKDKTVLEPTTAAHAIQFARALQTATGPTYNRIDSFLDQVGRFAKAAEDLRKAQAALGQLLATGEAA